MNLDELFLKKCTFTICLRKRKDRQKIDVDEAILPNEELIAVVG